MSAMRLFPTLTDDDFSAAALRIGCDRAAIKAVCQVEAPRGGFAPDGFPVTLFEGHKFSLFTEHRFDATNPTISYPAWTRQFYGSTWQEERARLNAAIVLDREAALKSASWGRFQIMGFNYPACGFGAVQKFVTAMCENEARQLEAFIALILEWGLGDELREHRWADFAKRYNGPSFAANTYDVRMAAAYRKLTQE